MIRTSVLLIAVSLAFNWRGASLAAEGSASASKFALKWKVLVGEWKGEDPSGSSSGGCGFHFDLSEHIIVRTNHAVLPGLAAAHDDLMVISPGVNDQARASYFDN